MLHAGLRKKIENMTIKKHLKNHKKTKQLKNGEGKKVHRSWDVVLRNRIFWGTII
jgi:hypothetical protein